MFIACLNSRFRTSTSFNPYSIYLVNSTLNSPPARCKCALKAKSAVCDPWTFSTLGNRIAYAATQARNNYKMQEEHDTGARYGGIFKIKSTSV